MREFLELLAVFAGIYLFDCIHWARRETVAFRSWWKQRAHVVAGEDMPGNQTHGIVLAQPLLPFGRVFLTQTFPLSLTKDAAVSFVTPATNPGPRPAQIGRTLQFETMRLDGSVSIETEARHVLVGKKIFVDAGSERLARRMADLITELGGLSPSKRDARIDAELKHALDVRAIEARVSAFGPATADLRAACTGELVLVFVLTPVAGLVYELQNVWLPLLASLVLAQAFIVWSFVRAHRALYPEEGKARRGHAILLSLSPPAAMRALDALSRDLLAEFHPLAAARVLLDEDEFRAFAARVLRDAHHPLPIGREGTDAVVAAAAESWRQRTAGALERFARKNGVPDALWAAPPAREGEDCVTWCPRCVQQFTIASGTCARCWDLALHPF
jgi:hypothetical protein